MRYRTDDWLEVVYGSGLDVDWGPARRPSTELRVRAAPGTDHLPPGEVRRIRVTVSPSDPRLDWRLYLQRADRAGSAPERGRVWWRVYPGTWQPLSAARECVAEGRGRVRVDVSIRIDGWDEGSPPRLQFVAETP